MEEPSWWDGGRLVAYPLIFSAFVYSLTMDVGFLSPIRRAVNGLVAFALMVSIPLLIGLYIRGRLRRPVEGDPRPQHERDED